MDATEEARVRRLQRLAFGAEASTDERRAALDELDRLGQRDATTTGEAQAASLPDSIDRVEPDVIVDDPGTAAARRSSGFALRVGVVTGVIAVAIGVVAGFAAGWQAHPNQPVGATAPSGSSDSANAVPSLHADVFAAMPIALETDAARVFDRPPTPADTPDLETPLAEITSLLGPIETRLLATSADATHVFAARDDADVCLLADFPDGGAASVCTQQGRFPTEGLSMSAGGPDVIVDVAWSPDGMLHLATG